MLDEVGGVVVSGVSSERAVLRIWNYTTASLHDMDHLVDGGGGHTRDWMLKWTRALCTKQCLGRLNYCQGFNLWQMAPAQSCNVSWSSKHITRLYELSGVNRCIGGLILRSRHTQQSSGGFWVVWLNPSFSVHLSFLWHFHAQRNPLDKLTRHLTPCTPLLRISERI